MLSAGLLNFSVCDVWVKKSIVRQIYQIPKDANKKKIKLEKFFIKHVYTQRRVSVSLFLI